MDINFKKKYLKYKYKYTLLKSQLGGNDSGKFFVIVYSNKDIPIEQLKTKLEETYETINIVNNPSESEDDFDIYFKQNTDEFLNKKIKDKATDYKNSIMLKLKPFEGIENMNDSKLTVQENKLKDIVNSLGYRLIDGNDSDGSWGGYGLWSEGLAIIPLIYEKEE